MKLPILVRLTLHLVVWADLLRDAADRLHHRMLRRAIDRIPPAYPKAVEPPPSLITCESVLIDDLRLREASGAVIASGPGMLPFKRALATYQAGRPS